VPEEPALQQFSVSASPGPSQDDVVTLLYRVADALEALGEVGVVDITYTVEDTKDGWIPSMTVFYEIEDDITREDDVVELAAAEADEVVRVAEAARVEANQPVPTLATARTAPGEAAPTSPPPGPPVWTSPPSRSTNATAPVGPTAQPPVASLSDRAYGDEKPALQKIKDLWSTRKKDRRF
jgi:hypothetical protein